MPSRRILVVDDEEIPGQCGRSAAEMRAFPDRTGMRDTRITSALFGTPKSPQTEN
jgi:hypothetical protein